MTRTEFRVEWTYADGGTGHTQPTTNFQWCVNYAKVHEETSGHPGCCKIERRLVEEWEPM